MHTARVKGVVSPQDLALKRGMEGLVLANNLRAPAARAASCVGGCGCGSAEVRVTPPSAPSALAPPACVLAPGAG